MDEKINTYEDILILIIRRIDSISAEASFLLPRFSELAVPRHWRAEIPEAGICSG